MKNFITKLLEGPARRDQGEDSVALVLNDAGDLVSIKVDEQTPSPLFRLTRTAKAFDSRLPDGRVVEVRIQQGRRWLDSAVELSVNGVRSNSTMWEERFWVKSWFRLLWFFSVTLLGVGLIPIGADVAIGWAGTDIEFHEEWELSVAATTAGALLGWVALRFRLNPLTALRIYHPVLILLACALPAVGIEITFSSLSTVFLLTWSLVPFWMTVRTAVNSLAGSGHPDASMKGPWISWSDVSTSSRQRRPTGEGGG